jgi:CRISPR system Cascade subunit CasE
MYISRIEIPWQRARNPYDIHRHLWRLFPGAEPESRSDAGEARSGFLFRIEHQQTGSATRVLIQSRTEPIASAEGIAVLGTRAFNPAPSAGQRLAFLLTANPIKTIGDAELAAKPDKRGDKCRVPLVREEEQRAWLARKFDGAARVEVCAVLPHPPLYFRKGNRGGKLATVTFEGELTVTAPERLRDLIENGVGPAKAFGCGLLLVRRID